MFRPTPDIQFNFSTPSELNYSTGVVIPTLHPVPGNQSEFAPNGILGSIYFRIPDASETGFESWAGLGYKLSKASGTLDVSDDLAANPDSAIEGLGAGTDDIYVLAHSILTPESFPDWRLGAGLEIRFHMLPRFERFFGTTLDYQLWAERTIGLKWGTGLRLTGFYTGLRTLGISQYSAAIASPEIFYQASNQTRLTGAISGEVPGASLNHNVLQTVGFSVSLAYTW